MREKKFTGKSLNVCQMKNSCNVIYNGTILFVGVTHKRCKLARWIQKLSIVKQRPTEQPSSLVLSKDKPKQHFDSSHWHFKPNLHQSTNELSHKVAPINRLLADGGLWQAWIRINWLLGKTVGKNKLVLKSASWNKIASQDFFTSSIQLWVSVWWLLIASLG